MMKRSPIDAPDPVEEVRCVHVCLVHVAYDGNPGIDSRGTSRVGTYLPVGGGVRCLRMKSNKPNFFLTCGSQLLFAALRTYASSIEGALAGGGGSVIIQQQMQVRGVVARHSLRQSQVFFFPAMNVRSPVSTRSVTCRPLLHCMCLPMLTGGQWRETLLCAHAWPAESDTF